MRKTYIVLLATLALAVVAQPASADVPASYETSSTATSATQICTTPLTTGVPGQSGVWTRLFDGCTVTVRCPFTYCQIKPGSGGILATTVYGLAKACNMRVRAYNVSGGLSWYRDYSDDTRTGTNASWDDIICQAKDWDGQIVRQGQLVTVQSNGVAGAYPVSPYPLSSVQSALTLTWYSGGLVPPRS